ncbi:uncharacterized protein LOC125657706 isoform X2 [Ostrea edulis]|uniref:uncharacterized protein LOC125657706 isoform X2 n=1 Tax=Ostrea edulis TaxID=37623 RepID=UPI0024AF2750|nr:uncharacterized protein LOC125657706 isoform X2 [Ostrea edulis]
MGFIIVFLLAVLPTLISSTPIPTSRFEHWRSPCTGPEAASQDIPDFNFPDFTPPTPSLPRTISELVFQMKETRDKVQELKHNYTELRVHQGDCENNLEAPYLRLDGFPSTPAFRGAMRMISEMNLTDILLTDYRKLSVVMIFVEQVRWDEEVYERDQFTPILNNIFQGLKSILCVLSNALTTQGSKVTDFVNRTHSMNQRYRTMSRTDNHDRDYIIMRESFKLFGNMILKYTALKDFLSNPN